MNDKIIARMMDFATKYMKKHGIARLGNAEITRLVPSLLNEDKNAKKQICITIDYDDIDENE